MPYMYEILKLANCNETGGDKDNQMSSLKDSDEYELYLLGKVRKKLLAPHPLALIYSRLFLTH